MSYRAAPMKILLVAIIASIAASALAGCAPAPTRPEPPVAPPVTQTPPPSVPGSPTAEPALREISVYLIRRERVQAVTRTVPAGTKAVLRAALESLLAGPASDERSAGLGTQIPRGTALRGVSIKGRTATIDLTARYATGGGSATMFARLAQVVFTATQFPSVDGVLFRIDGKPVRTFSAEGIELEGPQTRADFEDQSPAILVESPAWGGTLTGRGTVRGTANTFEANFRLQVRDAAGTMIVDRAVQATSGTGTRGTWSIEVPLRRAVEGSGTIRVFEESAKDGSEINIVVVPVLLRR